MPVLIEINSGREANKTGVIPEEVDDLIQKMAALANIHIEGLMTMGPRFGNPEDARPYFKIAKDAYERIAAKDLPNVDMRFLSMGMSNSYQIAIEEGANIIRIAVENTSLGWDQPGGGDAAADMQTAIQALSTVTVPDTSSTGVTFDFAGATVTESTFAAL